MQELNRQAMTIPVRDLAHALAERNQAKAETLAARDRQYGSGRVRIGSYMENLGWPGLFGYDMNRVFSDPAFALEMELRQRIFWLDNSLDDWQQGLWVGATAGMYFDMTLFGLQVSHAADGVPRFADHPIAAHPDLALIKPFDFRATGAMPDLIRQYRQMRQLAGERYGDAVTIGFPGFGRGPLDICVTMRGYERFVMDTIERPGFVSDFMSFVVTQRRRWNEERRAFLGEQKPAAPTTGVDDDWVNAPFISPYIFEEFVLPAYRAIREGEGQVTHFHTCGRLEPFVQRLLEVFPGIRNLDVSGWNDFNELDRLVDPAVHFSLAFVNSFVLAGSAQEHRRVLAKVARLARRRSVSVCAQAIVKLLPTYEETFERLNAFISLAREVLAAERGVQ